MKPEEADCAKLYLPGGIDGPGFLCIPVPAGSCLVRLQASLVGVLLQLINLRKLQASWPVETAGWMTRKKLAEIMGQRDGAYPLSPPTVGKYLVRLDKALDAGLGSSARSVQLFERDRRLGRRLTVEIEIVLGPA
jgi:hypothetical protein